MRITRKELYLAIWKTPAMHLAKTYGISDVALAKICRKLSLPKPNNSYWTRKAAGRQVYRPALPAADCLEFVEITPKLRPVRERIDTGLGSDMHTMQVQLASDLNGVAPEVSRLKAFLEARGVDRSGRLGVTKGSMDLGDVAVTPLQLDRAILVLDALIRLFAAMGHLVKMTVRKEFKGPPVILSVVIVDITIRFQIVERVLHSSVRGNGYLSRTEYVPIGLLQIQVWSEWHN